MDITITPGKLSGTLSATPSKSQAHRLLICAAFSDGPTELICPETNLDIEATVQCLKALGAIIIRTSSGYTVDPIGQTPKTALLYCGESGSTLRFMLPIVGALGIDATFKMEGRLPERPLSPLWEEMERMGCSLTRPSTDSIRCTGWLQRGNYCIDGSVSSQYITGLLFALSLIDGECHLEITGKVESKPYIHMTREAMALFQAPAYHTPGHVTVEGDWSNGAFYLAAATLGSELTVLGLNELSVQGDRAITSHLMQLDRGHAAIDVSDTPDLVPIMAVVAAARNGAVFTNIQRLRLKESDRVASTVAMIRSLGGMAEATEDTLTVFGTGLTGGSVDSHNDHRIAMAAAIGATVCTAPVTIMGAQSVNKSYPTFWEEYRRLGGKYEQYLR